ncbi:hypothetical protein KD050_21115 [Psychrobacillus sp. INOP01]|uniref:hypothetical protein n=1 Tax=Psychrobacillus sp. INOP01 TaxID=2829187 RepID=UPI001BA8A5E7|nr:hypothetical protein [Psychrobacillus sp. INOP01]QUG41718.1 hypothetical protein KD050_21115 [Psychrobacillus sp. INOP01]
MKLSQIIPFTISVFVSLVLLIFCFLRKLLLTTYTPVTYSMEELKSFIFLVALTTFFLILTLIFATKIQLIIMTVIYGFLFFPNFIAYIRRNFYFQDYEMLKFLDETMLLTYLFPFILGITLLVKNKSNKKISIPKG